LQTTFHFARQIKNNDSWTFMDTWCQQKRLIINDLLFMCVLSSCAACPHQIWSDGNKMYKKINKCIKINKLCGELSSSISHSLVLHSICSKHLLYSNQK
jgi:hypothetical protein